jgi:hypothetical protein
MPKLTIAYITARPTPRLKWFMESLETILPANLKPKIVIVDLFAEYRKQTISDSFREKVGEIVWTEPKPSVWHGKHKLTQEEFFSAGNSRNTAIALAPDGYLAMIDDLSVLTPTWLDPIMELMLSPHDDYVICGAFQKVKKLAVHGGKILLYEPYKDGIDSRWESGSDSIDVACPPNWMFGCSLCANVEEFLRVNGYPEYLCDGMGYEDSITGITMANAGSMFRYSRRMMTLESEEDHHNQPATCRIDPGVSPADKSHKMLELQKGKNYFDQDFGPGFPNIRHLRHSMLRGGQWPIRTTPTKEWFTGIDLKEFHKYHERIKTQ